MNESSSMHVETRLVHVGNDALDAHGDLVPPIHLATTYDQRWQDPLAYFYGRGENPTRENLEACLASIEDAAHALAFSSGQAAGMTALSLLTPGQRVIASDDVYGGTYSLLALAQRAGTPVTYVDLTELDALTAALTDDVKLIWIETPTNPQLKVCDVQAIAQLAERVGAYVVVDNTFAGPLLQRPLDLGAHVSLYSTTKSMAGHSDVIGGALVYNDDELHRQLLTYRTAAGNVPSPFDCFLVQRGLKTMALRVGRQVETAQRLAETLAEHSRVGAVHYPGLPSHPQHELAKRQMRAAGSIVTFDYLGDVELLLKRTSLWAVAVSLGSVHSLIECPASMTHRPIPREQRLALGITDTLVRLSPGIEAAQDLIDDLLQALG